MRYHLKQIHCRPWTRGIGELSKEAPVVVYCAYGFHVGCRTAGALRDAGFDAKYMTGGHHGWKAMGGPIRMKR
jgi:Fe-Mn family superoxide dismutase